MLNYNYKVPNKTVSADSEHTQTIISEVKSLLKTVCEESVVRARADLTAQSHDKDQSCWNCGRKVELLLS